jgi:hypothetical protein
MCSRLNADMVPQEFFEMTNPSELVSRECLIEGVEDVRLYPGPGPGLRGTICYMGSSVNYAPEGRTRIVQGVYDIETRCLSHSCVLEPPTDTTCEKNWTPVYDGGDGDITKIVYEWSKMTVGHVVDHHVNNVGGSTEGKLVVDSTLPSSSSSPWLGKFRGSTYFRPSQAHPDHLVGLVHFSEHEFPRHYYHVLVLLDRKTLFPWKHSRPFSFCHRTCIEFCIGMIETGGRYHFWLSQSDRDPVRVSVSVTDVPFTL